MPPTKLIGTTLGLILALALGGAITLLKRSDEPVEPEPNSTIPKTDRLRRTALIEALTKAPHRLRELPDGFSLTYYEGQKLIPRAAEWMDLETRLNSSLDMSVAILRNHGPLLIRVVGPQGVKERLIREWGLLLKPPTSHLATERKT